MSWTPDGRSIVFLALWCGDTVSLGKCENASGTPGSFVAQVRSVPAVSGGPLDHGPVLLNPRAGYPFQIVVHAVAGPEPGQLTLVVLSGMQDMNGSWAGVTVERVAARTGSVLATDYRLPDGGVGGGGGGKWPRDVYLSADPSGQHLLLTLGVPGGFVTGRIGDGEIRLLPAQAAALLRMADHRLVRDRPSGTT